MKIKTKTKKTKHRGIWQNGAWFVNGSTASCIFQLPFNERNPYYIKLFDPLSVSDIQVLIKKPFLSPIL